MDAKVMRPHSQTPIERLRAETGGILSGRKPKVKTPEASKRKLVATFAVRDHAARAVIWSEAFVAQRG
jgi:hypothetical protein